MQKVVKELNVTNCWIYGDPKWPSNGHGEEKGWTWSVDIMEQDTKI